jgi:hypothetical protein
MEAVERITQVNPQFIGCVVEKSFERLQSIYEIPLFGIGTCCYSP